MRGALVLCASIAAAGCGGEDADEPALDAHSVRFRHGDGEPPSGDYGVVIPIAGRAANVGAGDFTIEMWLKAETDSLLAWDGCRGGLLDGTSWLEGHVVFDRSQAGASSFIGLALFGDAISFGVGDQDFVEGGVCEPAYFNSGAWHHVAAVREGTAIRIFVDGVSTRELADFEAGDLSYQGAAAPEATAIVGGWKARNTIAPWKGWIDELRISTVARYPAESLEDGPLEADADTAALYHFDAIQGTTVIDSSLTDPIDAVRVDRDDWRVTYDGETPF